MEKINKFYVIGKNDKNLKKVYLPPNVWKLSNYEDLHAAFNVRQKLECPVCYTVKYPISHTCPLGHIICYNCFKTLIKVTKTRICPLCRSTPIKLSEQAKSLNKTYKSTKVSCRYINSDCQVLVYLSNLGQHEAHCIHKPVFCIYPGCKWTNSVWKNLHEHVFNNHPEITVKTSASFCLMLKS